MQLVKEQKIHTDVHKAGGKGSVIIKHFVDEAIFDIPKNPPIVVLPVKLAITSIKAIMKPIISLKAQALITIMAVLIR